jgi:hypothetical protein
MAVFDHGLRGRVAGLSTRHSAATAGVRMHYALAVAE